MSFFGSYSGQPPQQSQQSQQSQNQQSGMFGFLGNSSASNPQQVIQQLDNFKQAVQNSPTSNKFKTSAIKSANTLLNKIQENKINPNEETAEENLFSTINDSKLQNKLRQLELNYEDELSKSHDSNPKFGQPGTPIYGGKRRTRRRRRQNGGYSDNTSSYGSSAAPFKGGRRSRRHKRKTHKKHRRSYRH